MQTERPHLTLKIPVFPSLGYLTASVVAGFGRLRCFRRPEGRFLGGIFRWRDWEPT